MSLSNNVNYNKSFLLHYYCINYSETCIKRAPSGPSLHCYYKLWQYFAKYAYYADKLSHSHSCLLERELPLM